MEPSHYGCEGLYQTALVGPVLRSRVSQREVLYVTSDQTAACNNRRGRVYAVVRLLRSSIHTFPEYLLEAIDGQ